MWLAKVKSPFFTLWKVHILSCNFTISVVHKILGSSNLHFFYLVKANWLMILSPVYSLLQFELVFHVFFQILQDRLMCSNPVSLILFMWSWYWNWIGLKWTCLFPGKPVKIKKKILDVHPTTKGPCSCSKHNVKRNEWQGKKKLIPMQKGTDMGNKQINWKTLLTMRPVNQLCWTSIYSPWLEQTEATSLIA